MRKISVLLAAMLFFTGWAHAQTRLLSECAVQGETADTETLNCSFRATEPGEVSRAEIVVNGTPVEGTQFAPFGDYGTSAWLILIDRTDPARAQTVARSVDLAKQMMRKAQANRLMGIATFAGDLEMIVSPGDTDANLDTRLSTVKADGMSTEFYSNTIQAIRKLANVEADRHALIIITDGESEDTAYSREEVIAAANEADVTIFAIGFPEREIDTPKYQMYRRLAEETNGPYLKSVGGAPLPQEFLANFTDYIENGGRVEAPLADVSGDFDATLEVRFSDGRELSSTASLTASEKIEPELPRPETLLTRIYGLFSPVWPEASDWAYANTGLAWALLALPIILVFILLYLLMRRRRAGTDDFADATEEFGEAGADPFDTESLPFPDEGDEATRKMDAGYAGPVFGYFVMLDDLDNKFAIREKSVTIGRHSENDFRLNNDSVHRHHALFHLSEDLRGTITDLDTENGVKVNGTRITRKDIHNGDVIELGEVRFRYMAPDMVN